MTAKLDKLWSEVDELQPQEQLELLERIAHSLREHNTNNGSNGHVQTEQIVRNDDKRKTEIYQPTEAEVELELLEIFGADLMAEINADIGELPDISLSDEVLKEREGYN